MEPELVDIIEKIKNSIHNFFANFSSNISNLYNNHKKNIIIFIIVIILGILLINILKNVSFENLRNYSTLESKIKKDALNYIEYNGENSTGYIDLNTIYNFNVPSDYKKCELSSGYKIDTEEVYLICNKYISKNIKKISDNKNEYLTLKGENPYVMTQEEKYNEPGYIFDPKYKVSVIGNVTKAPKIYTIKYLVTEEGEPLGWLERLVFVENIGNTNYTIFENTDFTLELEGSSNESIFIGSDYKDSGATSYDVNDGDISFKIKTTGTVNTKKAGDYTLTYSVTNSKGYTLSETRTVSVQIPPYDLDYTIASTPSSDNESAIISLNITGSNYKNTLLPNNNKSSNRTISYKVTNNGIYNFKIYDSYDQYEEQSIEITSINKPYFSGVCSLEHKDNKTTVTVEAGSNQAITGYKYQGGSNNTDYINSSTYTFPSIVEYVSVIVKNDTNKTISINCSKKNASTVTNPGGGTQVGGTAEFHFLYNGRVDAILIRNGTHAAFIDSGYVSDGDFAVKYMQELGITKLDFVIGTHGDANHVGGLAPIIKKMDVGAVYLQEDPNNCKWCEKQNGIYSQLLSAMNSKKMKPAIVQKAGDIVKLGDITFKCISPINYATSGSYIANANSLNHIVTYKNIKVLLTADNDNMEAIMKKYGDDIKNIDILKHPHHGNNSLSDKFLDLTKPKYDVIQSSLKSELLSKQASTKKKLDAHNTKIYFNCEVGHVIFTTDGTKLDVKTTTTPKYKNACTK